MLPLQFTDTLQHRPQKYAKKLVILICYNGQPPSQPKHLTPRYAAPEPFSVKLCSSSLSEQGFLCKAPAFKPLDLLSHSMRFLIDLLYYKCHHSTCQVFSENIFFNLVISINLKHSDHSAGFADNTANSVFCVVVRKYFIKKKAG